MNTTTKKELGISKGEWNRIRGTKNPYFIQVFSAETDTGICSLSIRNSDEENEANAKLIADAGTTANLTGKLPSQLAEENKMLLEACRLNSMFPITTTKEQEVVYDFAKSLGWEMDCPVENWAIKFTRETIAKAEGRGE